MVRVERSEHVERGVYAGGGEASESRRSTKKGFDDAAHGTHTIGHQAMINPSTHMHIYTIHTYIHLLHTYIACVLQHTYMCTCM